MISETNRIGTAWGSREAARERPAPGRVRFRPGPGVASGRDSESGIALIVVFILFVVLYLIVFQLEYSTKMEEELSEVRATESQGAYAIISISGYVLSLLAEDLKNDASKQGADAVGATVASSSGAVSGQGSQRGTATPTQGDVDQLARFGINIPSGGGPTTGSVTAGSTARGGATTPAAGGGATGAAGPGSIDYITESMFLPTTQNVNNVNVKIRIRDNEGIIDLNQIWTYPRVETESVSDEQKERDTEAAEAMVEEISRAALDPSLAASDENLELNSPSLEWVVPTDESRELVREMLTRMIYLMIDLNVNEYGFFYQFQVPDPASLATIIEDYCYQRRSQPYQNKISLVSELLNLDGVTPELFYGPLPDFPSDEVYNDLYGEYAYSKDEFGDLVGEYQYIDPEFLADMEYRREELSMLTEQYGMFQNFPGLGLAGNSLTRNSAEVPESWDGSGLAVAPQPIGLRDLFCTVSTGKININTAPPPVLYGLLLSLDEDTARKVALDIEYYRYRYQEVDEEDGEGVQGVDDSPAKRVGAPMQPAPDPEEEEDLANQDLAGMDSAELAGMSSYEDYPTNYFTSLRQLILIDGEDGNDEDILNEEQIDRIDESQQSALQLVTHDLEKVVVFGSTYFTATLKIKTEKSSVVKVGTLVVHRDVPNSRMEVLQWKEYER